MFHIVAEAGPGLLDRDGADGTRTRRSVPAAGERLVGHAVRRRCATPCASHDPGRGRVPSRPWLPPPPWTEVPHTGLYGGDGAHSMVRLRLPGAAMAVLFRPGHPAPCPRCVRRPVRRPGRPPLACGGGQPSSNALDSPWPNEVALGWPAPQRPLRAALTEVRASLPSKQTEKEPQAWRRFGWSCFAVIRCRTGTFRCSTADPGSQAGQLLAWPAQVHGYGRRTVLVDRGFNEMLGAGRRSAYLTEVAVEPGNPVLLRTHRPRRRPRGRERGWATPSEEAFPAGRFKAGRWARAPAHWARPSAVYG